MIVMESENGHRTAMAIGRISKDMQFVRPFCCDCGRSCDFDRFEDNQGHLQEMLRVALCRQSASETEKARFSSTISSSVTEKSECCKNERLCRDFSRGTLLRLTISLFFYEILIFLIFQSSGTIERRAKLVCSTQRPCEV